MPGFDSPLGWLLALSGVLVAGTLSWTWRHSERSAAWGDFLHRDRPSRGYLGVGRRGALRPEESRRCQHVLITGPADQTTQRFVLPNVLLDADEGVSAVLFDTGQADGEPGGHEPSALRLLATGAPHHDVQVFAPFESLSLRFPLLSALGPPGTAELNQVELNAAGLAAALLHDPGAPTGNPLQERAQLALLEGLLLDAAARLGGSLQAVLRLAQAGPDALSAHLAGAARGARQRTHLFFSLRQEQQEAVAAALAITLAVFDNDHLDRATRTAVQDPRPGDSVEVALALSQPVVLYLRLPGEVTRSLSGQVLHRALQHSVLQQLLQAGAELGGAPPQHLSVYLVGPVAGRDPLPGWPARLSALRLTRVACHLLCPPESELPDAELTGPEVSGSGLFGQVLRLAPDPVQGAELRLADGRFTRVWLPTLGERRLGPVLNPLFGAARQGGLLSALDTGTLVHDLVLRRLLARRAAQVTWPATVLNTTIADSAAVPDRTDVHDLAAQDGASLPQAAMPGTEQGTAPTGPPGELIAEWTPRPTTLPPWRQHTDQHLSPPDQTSQSDEPTDPRAGDLHPAAAGLPEELEDNEVSAFDQSVFENPVEVRQVRLLKLLSEHRYLTPAQVVALTDLPETTVRRDLNILEDSGLVTSARVAGKRRYRLIPVDTQQP